jgi:hypothetical protein
MKTTAKLISILFFIALSQISNGQVAIVNTNLKIVNNRSCDITVNWEVSNCNNCPNSGCQYCNSSAVVATSPPYIVISGGGGSHFVDLANCTAPAATGAADCSFIVGPGVTNWLDVFVGLIEINYLPGPAGIWGSVNCGGAGCFAGTNSTTAGGTGTAGPAGCSAPWSMTWVYSAGSGITVTIN